MSQLSDKNVATRAKSITIKEKQELKQKIEKKEMKIIPYSDQKKHWYGYVKCMVNKNCKYQYLAEYLHDKKKNKCSKMCIRTQNGEREYVYFCSLCLENTKDLHKIQLEIYCCH